MLIFSFGLIIFSIISITAAYAQISIPSVKITSPMKGQKLPEGIKTLMITGTSSDGPNTNCAVSVLINDLKPYRNVIPNGAGKTAEDLSSWKYTFTSSGAPVIKEGNNRVTSKITCVNAKGNSNPAAQTVKFNSVNFTGVSNLYKPITPSKGINFSEIKNSKNVVPPHSVPSVNNGTIQHKNNIKTVGNTNVNNGTIQHKNNIKTVGNTNVNNGTIQHKNNIKTVVNATNQGSNDEKGTLLVPPFNIKVNSGITNSNNITSKANNRTTTNATNVIPSKVVISNQQSTQPNSTSIPRKPTSTLASNTVANNRTTTNATNVIPSKVVISNQSTVQPQSKATSVPPKPTIILSNNNSNILTKNQTLANARTPINNTNTSSNNTTITIINEHSGSQNSSIPQGANPIGPNLIFPIPVPALESNNLQNQSTLQLNPSSSNGNLGIQTIRSPPVVEIKPSSSVVNEEEQITLNAGASRSPSGSIASYSWVPLSNTASIISKGNHSPVFSFTVPKVQSDTHFAFRLTVTDSVGLASSATVDVLAKKTIQSNSASSASKSSLDFSTQSSPNSRMQISNSDQNANISAIEQSQNIPSKFLVNKNQVNIPSVHTSNQVNSSSVYIPPANLLASNDNNAMLSSNTSHNVTSNQSALAPPFTSATTSPDKVVNGSKESPVAVAGPDQIANAGSTVVVDASGSYDPAGGDLSYRWDQISGPQGTTVGGADTAGWSFKLPDVLDNAILKLKLTVTNKEGISSSDYLNIIDRSPDQFGKTDTHKSDHHN